MRFKISEIFIKYYIIECEINGREYWKDESVAHCLEHYYNVFFPIYEYRSILIKNGAEYRRWKNRK